MNDESVYQINGQKITLCQVFTKPSIERALFDGGSRLEKEWIWFYVDGKTNTIREGGYKSNQIDCLQDAINHFSPAARRVICHACEQEISPCDSGYHRGECISCFADHDGPYEKHDEYRDDD